MVELVFPVSQNSRTKLQNTSSILFVYLFLFLFLDEDTSFLKNLRWRKIFVKINNNDEKI